MDTFRKWDSLKPTTITKKEVKLFNKFVKFINLKNPEYKVIQDNVKWNLLAILDELEELRENEKLLDNLNKLNLLDNKKKKNSTITSMKEFPVKEYKKIDELVTVERSYVLNLLA